MLRHILPRVNYFGLDLISTTTAVSITTKVIKDYFQRDKFS